MKIMRMAAATSRRNVVPAGLLALGLATAGWAQHASAANAYATTSVEADQSALVFDAAFSNHVKTGRSIAAASRAYADKPWTNTVGRNFYGQ